MRLVNWRSLAIGAAGLGLAACGDDVVVANQGTLTASPASVTCSPGQTVAIGANLSPSSSGATFGFAASGVTPANAFTVAGTGSTATVTCTNAGSGTVTVTSGNQTFNVPVTVQGGGPGGFNVIIAPSSQSVAVGGTATFSGTIIGSGTIPAVRFRSAQPNIATVDSITGVARGVAVGVATILASPAGSPANAAAGTLTVLGSSQIVSSISATPNPITLQVGQTQQVAATVNLQPNAPTNTARTVTYTSQNNAIATVSTTGLVTGVANGTTSIIARSTADTAIFVAVPVTVRAQTAVRVTIASVTTANTNELVDITQPIGTAGVNQGAQANNNTGSIFVTLNVDPGDATINRVDLFLAPAASPNDTTNRVCSQVFTAALADAYRLALQNGSADVQPITCPINLAAFDTATGNPRIRNGDAVLRARVTGSFPGTTGSAAQASQIAQFTQNLRINNRSGFFVRVTNTPDAAQVTNSGNQRGTAQGPDGRNWVAGTLNFAILPVSFDTVNSGSPAPRQVTVTLTDSGAYGFTALNPLTRSLTVTAAASGPTTVTFPGRTATQPVGVTAGTIDNLAPRTFVASDQNLDGITSGPTGTRVVVSGIGFNADQALNTLSATLNGVTQTLNVVGAQNQIAGSFNLNVDNLAPQPAATFNIPAATLTSNFTLTPTGYVGFLGAAATAATVFAPNFDNSLAGPNAVLGVTGNGDFGGVDRVTTSFFADTISTLASLTSTNVQTGGIRFVNGASLPAANTNTFYAAAARFVDVLGNARNQLVAQGTNTLNAAGQLTALAPNSISFGIDLTRPTLTTTGVDSIVNIANQGVAQNNVATQYQDDIGFGGTPLTVIGERLVRVPDQPSTAAPQRFCFTGLTAGVATFGTTAATTCSAVAVAGTSTIAISNTANGQYSFSIVARDQAGNASDTARVRRYVDVQLPTPGSISLPQVLTGNTTVQFTSSASDNLELGTAYPQVSYGMAGPEYGTGRFQLSYAAQSLTTLGRAFDNVFTATNSSITLTVPSFLRSATFATAAGVPAVPTAANLADSLIAVVTDAAIAPGFQANQTTTVVPIPPSNIPLTGFGPTLFATGNQTSQINGFTLSVSSPTIALTRSATFTVQTAGQIGAFINPLARVELWYSQVGAAAVYQRLALVSTGLTTDNTTAAPTVGRVISSTLTFSPTGTALEGGVTATTGVEYNIIAVGVTTAGDALISAPVRVTITAAP